jgi:cytochrome b6-f complex iron-sulfur subunit
MPEDKSRGLSRKNFFWKLSGTSMGLAMTGSAVHTLQFLTPKVLFEPPTRFQIGLPEDYPAGSVITRSENQLFIVRAKEGNFHAMSSVCSHLGCITNYREADGLILCPCHGSKFDAEGNVLDGPAPRPLTRWRLEQNDRGQLIVDLSEEVDQDAKLKV